MNDNQFNDAMNTYFISLINTNINLEYTDYFSTYLNSLMKESIKFDVFKFIEYLFWCNIQHK